MRDEPTQRVTAKQARDGDVVHPRCGRRVNLGDPDDYAKAHPRLHVKDDRPSVELRCLFCPAELNVFEVIIVGPLFN